MGNWTHVGGSCGWALHLTRRVLSWVHEYIGSAVTHLAVAASNAKSALQHPWLSYSRGHQCPLKGSVDHRHSLVFLTQVVGWGEMCQGMQDPDLDYQRAWGHLVHTPLAAAAPAPASHPKYTCSLVSASLGWIRAQLWGPHPRG